MAKQLKHLDKVLVDIGKETKQVWSKFLDKHNSSGELKNSIKFKLKDHKLVLSIAEHAIYLDKGTRPHMPPVDSIRKWASSKGLNPWAVAMNIKKYGTEAHPFLDEYKRVFKNAKKKIQEATRKDIMKLVGGKIKNKRLLKIKI